MYWFSLTSKSHGKLKIFIQINTWMLQLVIDILTSCYFKVFFIPCFLMILFLFKWSPCCFFVQSHVFFDHLDEILVFFVQFQRFRRMSSCVRRMSSGPNLALVWATIHFPPNGLMASAEWAHAPNGLSLRRMSSVRADFVRRMISVVAEWAHASAEWTQFASSELSFCLRQVSFLSAEWAQFDWDWFSLGTCCILRRMVSESSAEWAHFGSAGWPGCLAGSGSWAGPGQVARLEAPGASNVQNLWNLWCFPLLFEFSLRNLWNLWCFS